WWPSRRFRSATTKPASTSTFLAIALRSQVPFLASAQIRRQAIHRADKIGDGLQGRQPAPRSLAGKLQALPDNVRLRNLPRARLGFDLRQQRLGQSYVNGFHARTVLRYRQNCKTTRKESLTVSVWKTTWQLAFHSILC